jgi:thymidylate synthase
MNWLQIVIRNGKVYLRVLFRSQDFLLGLPENLVGCAALQEWIVSEFVKLGIPVTIGNLTLISTIPHIYKKRDTDDFDKMRSHIYALKIQKNWKARTIE